MHGKNATRRAAVALPLLAAAGYLAAVTLGPTAATAYSTTDLLNNGYRIRETFLTGGCHDWKAIPPPGVGNFFDIGSDCDAGFQASLDAFFQATCPCIPKTVTLATTATTVLIQTNTETATTTMPAQTVTAPTQPVTLTRYVQLPPVTVKVIPQPPVATFTAATNGLVATFTDGSGTDGTVSWQFGDGTVGGGSPVTHGYAKPGMYAVLETVIAKDGLASQTMQNVTVAYARRGG